MQRTTLISIFLILFLTSAAAQEIEINPKEITSALIEINISGKIHTAGGVDEITYRQTFPLETGGQKILSVNSTPEHEIITDEHGNREIVLAWTSPESRVLDYEIIIQIEKHSFSIIPAAADTTKYLKNDHDLTRWSQEIKDTASGITTSDNDLINAAEISSWIHENIKYDLGLATEEKGARWTYENKKGTCDEFSHLLIAMARAEGIPAREVGGIAYVGDKWTAHAWSEIYYGGRWIPFDSSYNELGFVDGTHITYSIDTNNAQIAETIHWKSHKGINFKKYSESIGNSTQKYTEGIYNEKWETVKFLKFNKEKILDAKLNFPSHEVGENTAVNGTLELRNLINNSVIGNFDVLAPEKINYLKGREIFYMSPYEKTNLTLNFEVPGMENKKFKYIFPIIVETFPYAAAEQNLSVNPSIINGVSTIITDKGVRLEVAVTNRNPVKREFIVDVCINDSAINVCKTKILNLTKNSNKNAGFLFEIPDGNYALFIKARTSGGYDEFTGKIRVDVSDEIEIPYIGNLRIEEFLTFIIAFLILAVAAMILLRMR